MYNPPTLKLKDVLVDGEWQEEKCDVEWNDAIRNIINMEEVELLDGTPDKAIWAADSEGKFTITTAWDIWRNKKETIDTHSQIGHKNVPFKMTFITWRALTKRLPTDERLVRMGITVVAHCCCCTTPGAETVEDLFCSGDFSQKVWSNFCGSFGIQWRGTLLIQLLKKWWTYRAKNTIASFVAKIIPQFVVWELWRLRCASKYGSELPSIQRLIVYGSELPSIQRLIVFISQNITHWAEGQAMLIGLQKAVAMGINEMILEADSKVLVCSVKEEADTPWRLLQTVNKIKEIMEEKKVTVKHCYREANRVADRLAAISHTHKQHITTSNSEALPRQIRGLLHLDRLDLAAF
uniref:Uncharacterized protein LOC104218683 n=1 Tax=Nicotiana sylvestris TaxID=4096 RepID=A0A1U7VME1_NICSY|nr:PREDICTED: uncharacterized protein LOC104218683 [Nicotiana sylvestris]